MKKGYHAEEISDGAYWVTSGWYDCMFIRTGAGVIAVDAPPVLGELLLTAIEEVADGPVTHFIYCQCHADHVGAAAEAVASFSSSQPSGACGNIRRARSSGCERNATEELGLHSLYFQ
jgi:glyoxylase-like metal-dependent hydrolase (beta-lactamase superfamily II)